MAKYLVKPPYGSQLNRSHPLAKGLVGSYIFSEGGGLSVYNSTGNKRSAGVLTDFPAAPWLTGPHGRSLLFDGSNDRITIPESSLVHGNGHLSIFVRCKFNGFFSFPTLGSITGAGINAYHWGTGSASGDGSLVFVISDVSLINSGLVLTSGAEYAIGFAFQKFVGCNFYVFNLSAGTVISSTVPNTNTPTSKTGAGSSIGVKWDGVAGTFFSGRIDCQYIWGNRHFNQKQFSVLASDPFCMFRRQRIPIPVKSSSAVTNVKRQGIITGGRLNSNSGLISGGRM